jgi:glycosyltransferase involved in cell wall biosynthesis
VKKIRVAFYLDNSSNAHADLSTPEFGNPGIGGTEYLIVATAYYLFKFHSKKIEIILYATNTKLLPPDLNKIKTKDLNQAINKASRQFIDIFIYRPLRDPQINELELFKELNLKAIAWLHVTPTPKHIRFLASCSQVIAAVCVEHEQHDQLLDSPLSRKLTYIVNGFDVKFFRHNLSKVKKEINLVVHIGAIVPQKSFHILARSWPQILKRCPEAKLKVIGSAALYNDNEELGDWKLSYKSYEDNFIKPYLSDSDGNLLKSVEFLGVLDLRKKIYMAEASVGVANPVGINENCPATSLEFQALGTPVVGQGNFGNLDTMVDKHTGLLANNEHDFVNKVCFLLENPKYANSLGKNGPSFVRRKYSWEKTTKNWIDLFNLIYKYKNIKKYKMKHNYLKHYKLFIFVNALFQKMLGRFIRWPFLCEIKEFISKYR